MRIYQVYSSEHDNQYSVEIEKPIKYFLKAFSAYDFLKSLKSFRKNIQNVKLLGKKKLKILKRKFVKNSFNVLWMSLTKRLIQLIKSDC
jgi:hypothetical protein